MVTVCASIGKVDGSENGYEVIALRAPSVTEVPVTSSQIARAHDILSRHSMIFFDALILANAEESQDKQRVSNRLDI